MDDRRYQTSNVYPTERRNDTKRILGWFILFFIAAWVQITPLILIDETHEFLRNQMWFIPIGVILQISGVFMFYFLPQLRRHPLDKLWVFLMVECSVLIALPWCAHFEDHNVGKAIGIALVSLLLTILLAIFVKVPTSNAFFITAAVFRVLAFCIGMSFIIAYLATKLYYIFVAASALIFSVVFFELILLFKLIFSAGLVSRDDFHFESIAAVTAFDSVMIKIFFILPCLQQPYELPQGVQTFFFKSLKK